MKTDEANPQHWFLLAAERLKMADVIFAHEGASYSGIELLQEAVERYLKGFPTPWPAKAACRATAKWMWTRRRLNLVSGLQPERI